MRNHLIYKKHDSLAKILYIPAEVIGLAVVLIRQKYVSSKEYLVRKAGMRIQQFFPWIRIRIRLSWKKNPDPDPTLNRNDFKLKYVESGLDFVLDEIFP